MHKPVLVSVIINNYNYARFLKEAIDSAINQTYPCVEVIVVDDGSTDGSAQIINEYGNTIIPVLKENGGQGSAFNAGFKRSKGEIIIFLDADDLLLSSAVANAVALFTKPGVIKAHWQMWRINKSGERTNDVVPDYPLIEGDLLNNLIKYGPDQCGGPPFSPPTSGNAWSRKFLEQVLPMPEAEYKLGADQYLFVLAPVFGGFRCLSEPQGYYRIHGSNDTQKPLQTYVREFFARYEHGCETLSRVLKNRGIEVNPYSWTQDSWYHKVYAAMQEIAAVIPPAVKFILVDQNLWINSDFGNGRRHIPFLEREGHYWGPPADDEEGILEIERLRQRGAAYIVFVWFCFWWFEYYPRLHDYLKANYLCHVKNERMVIFGLQNSKTEKPEL